MTWATAAAAVTIFVFATAVIRQVLVRCLHPMRREDGDVARDLLLTCQRIFGLSRADGGWLSYPWDVDGVEVHEQVLADQLGRVANRSGDPALTQALTECRAALRGVFANADISGPTVWIVGTDLPPREPALVARAERQVQAADKGGDAVARAQARIAKLEVRSRWLRSQ